MDMSSRVGAFLDEWRDDADVPDSLPQLVRTHVALASLYRGLATNPGRAASARGLLEDLSAEYDRLLRRVGEEVLARAMKRSGDAVTLSPPSNRGRDGAPISGVSEPNGLLLALLERVGAPPLELTPEQRVLEVDRLREAVSEEAMRDLRLLPNDVQRTYLRFVTARLNAARGLAGVDVALRDRVGRLLGVIRDYTREHRPGAVYGLSRDHEPKSGSWEADAHYLWHRLSPGDDDAPASRRAPLRDADRSGEDEEDERETPPSEPLSK
ncbi:MAG TPA: hypothetical protein VGM06_18455 [Polyangiaceae bacterium]